MMYGQTNRFISGDASSIDRIQSGLPSSTCLDVLLVLTLMGMKNVECWERVGRGEPKMTTILPAIRKPPLGIL
jgi:hypothetical protein